jgi:peroxiredoxin
MTRRAIAAISAVTVLLGGLSLAAITSKHNRQLDIGQPAPAWPALPAVDGSKYALSDLADAKAIVVVFMSSDCPVAASYEGRLSELAVAFREQGLVLVAINVNHGEDLAGMKQRAEQREYPFIYVRDDSQQTARDYGAQCTPHAFLLDHNRSIAYMGAIDDDWTDASKVKARYLRDAIDAVLAGETPSRTEAKQIGCGIKWKD